MKSVVFPFLNVLIATQVALGQSPTVISVQPGRHVNAAPMTGPLRLTFSQPINPASTNGLRVQARFGGQRAGSVGVTNADVTFTPASAFRPGEAVTVMVPASVQSTSGAAVLPFVYEFTTAVGAFGGGTFGLPATNAEVGVSSGPVSLLLRDLDGDGDLDMVTNSIGGSGSYVISVRLNDGVQSGNFVVPANGAALALGTGSTRAMASGDFDGDGLPDLVASTGGNTMGVWHNSAGSFVAPAAGATVSTGALPLDAALGDVNGDGSLDLVTANINGTVSVRINNGAGVFAAPAINSELSVAAVGLTRVLLGDVDNDGDLDMLVTDGTTVYLRHNDGLNTGKFTTTGAGSNFSTGGSIRSMALGDVNGDGQLDLVLSRAPGLSGLVEVRLNNGNSELLPWTSVAVGNRAEGLALGDVDGDGDLDVVVGNDNYNVNAVSLRLNAGVNSGTFVEPLDAPEPTIGARFPWAVALGDVNGDGQLDVLTANNNNSGSGPGGGTGTVSVRLNQLSALRAGLAPATGSYGNVVTIRASDVRGATAVSFNGTNAPAFRVVSSGVLEATVPNGATTGPVRITTPRGTLTSSTNFVVGVTTAVVSRWPGRGPEVYPNPAHQQFTVAVPSIGANTTLRATVRNLLGQVVSQQQLLLPPTGTRLTVDARTLSAGVYVVQLQAGAFNTIKRIVIE